MGDITKQLRLKVSAMSLQNCCTARRQTGIIAKTARFQTSAWTGRRWCDMGTVVFPDAENKVF